MIERELKQNLRKLSHLWTNITFYTESRRDLYTFAAAWNYFRFLLPSSQADVHTFHPAQSFFIDPCFLV